MFNFKTIPGTNASKVSKELDVIINNIILAQLQNAYDSEQLQSLLGHKVMLNDDIIHIGLW